MKELPSFTERRRTWDAPEFAKCYCAVTVTAVAGVAAAGTAAYSSYSQGKATKDAQAGIAGNKEGAYGSKVELPDYEDNVFLPAFDSQGGAKDMLASLPMLSQISQNVTVNSQRSRDRLTGGLSSDNLKQAGADINSFLKGDIPDDVKDKVMRMVAERSGGAFSPSGQAGQAASSDFARSIGLTSVDMMKLGLTYAPQWESLTDSFTYKPQQAFGDALMALRERNNYVTSAAGIQLQRDQNQYTSEVNQARADAMPDPQVMGFTNDNLKLGSLKSQQDQNTINAMLGTVKAAGAAYAGASGSSAFPNTTQHGGSLTGSYMGKPVYKPSLPYA